MKHVIAAVLVLAMVALPSLALADDSGYQVGALGGSPAPAPVEASQKKSGEPAAVDALHTDIAPAFESDSIKPLYPFVGNRYNIPAHYTKPYVVAVDTANQVITVVKRGAGGEYDVPVKYFICSTGTDADPTPPGTYLLPHEERYDWLYFKTYKCYVRYPVRIQGNYFFHSLLYSSKDLSTMSTTSFNKLGQKASHGCIRMLDADIQWISENVEAGSAAVVYAGGLDAELNRALLPHK